MTTDTNEKGLERLICTALAGHPCDPPPAGALIGPRAAYGGVGWNPGSHHDYDREYCLDLAQLAAFLRDTQPDVAEALALDKDGPTRRARPTAWPSTTRAPSTRSRRRGCAAAQRRDPSGPFSLTRSRSAIRARSATACRRAPRCGRRRPEPRGGSPVPRPPRFR